MDELIYRAKKISYMYQEWKRIDKLIVRQREFIESAEKESGNRLIRLINGKPNGYEYSETFDTWATKDEFERGIEEKKNEYKKLMTKKKDIEFKLSIWIKT